MYMPIMHWFEQLVMYKPLLLPYLSKFDEKEIHIPLERIIWSFTVVSCWYCVCLTFLRSLHCRNDRFYPCTLCYCRRFESFVKEKINKQHTIIPLETSVKWLFEGVIAKEAYHRRWNCTARSYNIIYLH